jgi:hypothetical protein
MLKIGFNNTAVLLLGYTNKVCPLNELNFLQIFLPYFIFPLIRIIFSEFFKAIEMDGEER